MPVNGTYAIMLDNSRMRCSLCREVEDLRRSHVIPEFIYKPLYDEKHRFHVVSTGLVRNRAMEQKGIRENLLCGRCEEQLSRYERYARSVLFAGTEILTRGVPGGVEIPGIDYRKFKLFQLSVLWRVSIARNKIFRDVSLGPHETEIRQRLKSEDPGKPHEYGCIVTGLHHKRDVMKNIILQPGKVRVVGHLCYRFIFGGAQWTYFVSSHNPPDLIRNAMLSDKGTMFMSIRDIADLGYFRSFAHDLVRKNGDSA